VHHDDPGARRLPERDGGGDALAVGPVEDVVLELGGVAIAWAMAISVCTAPKGTKLRTWIVWQEPDGC
jgi:hypothetical protein